MSLGSLRVCVEHTVITHTHTNTEGSVCPGVVIADCVNSADK